MVDRGIRVAALAVGMGLMGALAWLRPATVLVKVIEKQNERNEEQARRIAEFSAAVGMWQARAMHLEAQMQQLTATVEAPASPEGDETGDASSPSEPKEARRRVETDDQIHMLQHQESGAPEAVWARLRRWRTGSDR